MPFPPVRTINVRGFDPATAPPNLLPYLDACDGAMVVGGEVGVVNGQPCQTHTIWELYRGGFAVGRVTVEGVPRLRGVPAWWPVPPEARGWIAARRARQARRRAGIRGAMIGFGATLAIIGYVVGLFAWGYLSAQ